MAHKKPRSIKISNERGPTRYKVSYEIIIKSEAQRYYGMFPNLKFLLILYCILNFYPLDWQMRADVTSVPYDRCRKSFNFSGR